MKYIRYITTLTGVLLLTHNIYANDYDFRKTRWGMPIVQVKAIENLNSQWKWNKIQLPDKGNISTITYGGLIFNRRCNLMYHFEHGKLSAGSYTFNAKKLDVSELKQLYDSVLKTLSNKYGDGTPIRDTGMKWFTANKRTEITLEYDAKSDSIQIIYISLLDKLSDNLNGLKNTSAEDAF
jgi:hypothetical protein